MNRFEIALAGVIGEENLTRIQNVKVCIAGVGDWAQTVPSTWYAVVLKSFGL
ncbi:MAG: hypothetical protein RQM92_15875 [Candidatus Syntrophopropionicum ammoniitolerans]